MEWKSRSSLWDSWWLTLAELWNGREAALGSVCKSEAERETLAALGSVCKSEAERETLGLGILWANL